MTVTASLHAGDELVSALEDFLLGQRGRASKYSFVKPTELSSTHARSVMRSQAISLPRQQATVSMLGAQAMSRAGTRPQLRWRMI